jgi:hypothetical protein
VLNGLGGRIDDRLRFRSRICNRGGLGGAFGDCFDDRLGFSCRTIVGLWTGLCSD